MGESIESSDKALGGLLERRDPAARCSNLVLGNLQIELIIRWFSIKKSYCQGHGSPRSKAPTYELNMQQAQESPAQGTGSQAMTSMSLLTRNCSSQARPTRTDFRAATHIRMSAAPVDPGAASVDSSCVCPLCGLTLPKGSDSWELGVQNLLSRSHASNTVQGNASPNMQTKSKNKSAQTIFQILIWLKLVTKSLFLGGITRHPNKPQSRQAKKRLYGLCFSFSFTSASFIWFLTQDLSRKRWNAIVLEELLENVKCVTWRSQPKDSQLSASQRLGWLYRDGFSHPSVWHWDGARQWDGWTHLFACWMSCWDIPWHLLCWFLQE